MVSMARNLSGAGYPTMTFNYAYTESGRRAPDRPNKLLAVHAAAADRLATYVDGVVLAGKSMGGRMSSHLAGDLDWPARGLVYLGYPLVAMGKTVPRPVDHLHRIAVAQLFVSGSRDRLGPLDLIQEVASRLDLASVFSIEEGDHSLNVPKRTGKTAQDVLAEVAGEIDRWIRDVVAPDSETGA